MSLQVNGVMISPVDDDRKLPENATPIDAGAASRAAGLPAAAVAAAVGAKQTSDGDTDVVARTYREAVGAKRPCEAKMDFVPCLCICFQDVVSAG